MRPEKPLSARISNQQVSATLLGSVTLDAKAVELHYLSVVGPKASLKALAAALSIKKLKRWDRLSIRKDYNGGVQSEELGTGDIFQSEYDITGAKGMRQYWGNIPNTSWAHLIMSSEEIRDGHILLVQGSEWLKVVDTSIWRGYSRHRGYSGYEVTSSDRTEAKELAKRQIADQLVASLNKHSNFPILPEWGAGLLEEGLENRWIKEITAMGDALVAYRWYEDDHKILTAIRRVVEAQKK